MLFAAFCTDKDDHLNVRMDNRPAHLDFLGAKGDEIVYAGPTLKDDGETPGGSLIIFEAEDLASARDWIAGDPYAKAGLFSDVQVRPWKKVLGAGF
ncbi:YciI family protein [Sneathiella sp. P13V-1]|uniref:YciI family protein n=1 Tax=Sneathiella sp. P13V-1 TaxID=2697366 RepID=UPI00187B7637|nr:YciI family protein [Sneathiella sp. P13V-1]